MKRIFLVDDHPMLLSGLRHLIGQESDLSVCGEASTAVAALEEIPVIAPDLVVTDLTLSDKSGLELIKDLLAIRPETLIFVFSMHDEMLYAERVLRAGGRGYLMKGSASELFISAVREVLGGAMSLSPRVSSHILSRMVPGGQGEPAFGPATFTDRELEVFQLLGQGFNTPQIGDKLHISPRTVDAHRNNIRLKLALPDSAAVLREAVIWVELGGRRLNSTGEA